MNRFKNVGVNINGKSCRNLSISSFDTPSIGKD